MSHTAQGSGLVAFHHHPRSAFTLVELMVVIGIIGVLTAISVPIVMQALAKARNAAIKAEIDMLHMAIMNYKNQYGSFPPAFGSSAANHIKRLFPRSSAPYPVKKAFSEDKNQNLVLDSAQGEDANGNNSLDGLFDTIPLAPDTALAFWLFGFSNNPSAPTAGETKPLFDFDKSRLESQGSFFTGRYRSANASGSGFYRYVDGNNYYFTASGRRFPTPWVEFNPTTASIAVGEDSSTNPANGSIDTVGGATEDANSNGMLDLGEPFNSATFQIIHPGRDGEFGTDDDLSNFWPGTRREYLDSLQ